MKKRKRKNQSPIKTFLVCYILCAVILLFIMPQMEVNGVKVIRLSSMIGLFIAISCVALEVCLYKLGFHSLMTLFKDVRGYHNEKDLREWVAIYEQDDSWKRKGSFTLNYPEHAIKEESKKAWGRTFSKKRQYMHEGMDFARWLKDGAIKAGTVEEFKTLWDGYLRALGKMHAYEWLFKEDYGITVNTFIKKCDEEYFWHLKDAVENDYNSRSRQIKGVYRNNPQKQKELLADFNKWLANGEEDYDDETKAFINRYSMKLSSDAGIPYKGKNETDFVMDELARIDKMEGHEFENWCADLLQYSGFTHVMVTRGSGDQGVDILADFSDVKYAIQCKCYGKDLGNKPIQEVYAGMKLYGCDKASVMTNVLFTPGGNEAAKATEVELWDRGKIIEFLKKKEEVIRNL